MDNRKLCTQNTSLYSLHCHNMLSILQYVVFTATICCPLQTLFSLPQCSFTACFPSLHSELFFTICCSLCHSVLSFTIYCLQCHNMLSFSIYCPQCHNVLSFATCCLHCQKIETQHLWKWKFWPSLTAKVRNIKVTQSTAELTPDEDLVLKDTRTPTHRQRDDLEEHLKVFVQGPASSTRTVPDQSLPNYTSQTTKQP